LLGRERGQQIVPRAWSVMDIVTVSPAPDNRSSDAILAGQLAIRRASSLSEMLEVADWISARIFGLVVACLCSLMSMNLLPDEIAEAALWLLAENNFYRRGDHPGLYTYQL
jgi:hypothetical protein